MKKNISMLIVLSMLLSTLMTSYISAEEKKTYTDPQNKEEWSEEQRMDMPGNPPPFGERPFDSENNMGEKPMHSGDPMGKPMGGPMNGSMSENPVSADSYTPLEMKRDNIFSDRDLDSDPDLSEAVQIPVESSSVYTIDSEGIYVLSGEASDFTVQIEADKDDKVQLVLQDADISNDDFPVIYVKSADKCFVTASGDNKLSVNKEYVSDDDTNTDAVIFSKKDLTLNGTGSLTIVSAAGNGVSTKDDLIIASGDYIINCAKDGLEANDSISIYEGQFTINSDKDAIHCENDKQQGAIYIKNGSFELAAGDDGIQATTSLVVDGGEFNITAAEGLEGTYVQINGGKIRINASDDGINAARKSNDYDVVIEINGGEITIVMGAGDTDGLDANGIIVVNGGTVDVTGRSTFDADMGTIYNGGTIIINGTVSDTIPVSDMGGQSEMAVPIR